jgi:FtsP/CotA-like multicopper oxidase with cupredoxin domain
MKTRFMSGIVSVAVVALLGAACSDSDSDSDTASPGGAGTQAAETDAVGPAPAGNPGPLSNGPCPYDPIDLAKFGGQDFKNPPDERFTDGSKTLTVKYSDANTMVGGCQVKLRSYNGQLIGPTIRAKPGETIDFTLKNELPPGDPARDIAQEEANAHLIMTPNSFNTTNIHYHGLHVSPEGDGDNVLLAIQPGQDFRYKVELPADHPAGTYWYHAHAHGSSSIQVGSGMVGALIIEDDTAKLPASLREATAREKVVVLEQILYDTHGAVDNIEAAFPDSDQTKEFCEQGLDTCTWQFSNRRTLVNGQIVPVIHMQPGEVQRWRLIDATFRESLHLKLQDHELHEIALDGLYTGTVDTWKTDQSLNLESGYRSDVLIKASSTPGTYEFFDAAVSAEASVKGAAEDKVVLAVVTVEGAPIEMALPTADEMKPLGFRSGEDLRAKAKGVQQVEFMVSSDQEASAPHYFQVNGHAFNESQTRFLELNATDSWRITTVGDPEGVPRGKPDFAVPPVEHIFHIHVNPFQVEQERPAGSRLVWRDTVIVRGPDIPGEAADPVWVYTDYTDFTGKFVMHCHILDHEDLGMMELMEVVEHLPMGAHQPGG